VYINTYICKSVRTIEWKEDKSIKDEFRARLKDEQDYAYRAIKRIADTIILDEITENWIQKRNEKDNADESKHAINKSNVFKFDNMTMIMINIKF
jgi:hypothetical protein